MGGAGNRADAEAALDRYPYAAQRAAGLFEAAEISAQERDDLEHFVDHGWLIMPGAIAPDLVDRFVADIRGHYKHPGKFLTTDHRNKQPRLKLSGSMPDHFESLFDLYVNLASAREVCFHPRISRFLSLVFDTKPVACQQLLFQ